MGGCVSSADLERYQVGRVFEVWNINEHGEHISRGRIEVTENALVLHQRNTGESITWPLRSLRRYGFDANLFSFESGRRCATGPGVYAFKCVRAESLFNTLQEKILSSGHTNEDELSTHSVPPQPQTQSLPQSQPPQLQQTQIQIQLQPAPPSDDSDDYLQPIVIQSPNNNIQLDDETNYAKLDDLLKQEHQHLYMNVNVNNASSSARSAAAAEDEEEEEFSCDHCYANVTAPINIGKCQVNYAVLDLRKRNNNNSLKVAAKETTTMTLEGYTKIDFDKTAALSNSINPALDNDDDQSVRKTRHNSNALTIIKCSDNE